MGLLTWAEQSEAVGREDTVEEAAATPPPSLRILVAKIFYSKMLPTLATMQANPLQSRWSALLLRSGEPSSAPAIPSSCLVQFTIG